MLEAVIEKLQTKQSRPLTQKDIFSDGAAQHFKQKFMMTFITGLLHTKSRWSWWHSQENIQSVVLACKLLAKTAE